MFLLIDNYDSFTYNLYHYLGELGAEVDVRRNDLLTADEALAMQPQGIVISPGPGNPDQAGISLDVIREFGGEIPILGVCLGMQCIAQAYGGTIVRADRLMHGKTSQIRHDGKTLFSGLESPLEVGRYHSLVIDPATVPDGLEVSATSEEGEIMGVRHRELPIEGVQFHPEFDRTITRAYILGRREALAAQGLDVDCLAEGCVESPNAASLLRRFSELALATRTE